MLRATVLLLLAASATAALPGRADNRAGRADDRVGRGWFDRPAETVTEVLTMREFVTDLLPSSCVVVQTALPSCRHLRALEEIRPARPGRIMQTDAPLPRQHQGWKPMIQPSSPVRQVTAPRPKATPPVTRQAARNATQVSSFWNNWNPFAARIETVTSTVVETVTTQYLDPNTVVTFSVKGCRPSRLPFDLPECNHEVPHKVPKADLPAKSVAPAPEPPLQSGLIMMAPIQFVPMQPVDVDMKEGQHANMDVAKEDKKEPVKVPEPEKAAKVSMVVGVEEEGDKGKVQLEENKEPNKDQAGA